MFSFTAFIFNHAAFISGGISCKVWAYDLLGSPSVPRKREKADGSSCSTGAVGMGAGSPGGVEMMEPWDKATEYPIGISATGDKLAFEWAFLKPIFLKIPNETLCYLKLLVFLTLRDLFIVFGVLVLW